MRNRIFQFVWFAIKPLIKTGPFSDGIAGQYNQYIWKFRIAKLFGGVETAIMGDSDSVALDRYRALCKFRKVTIVVGKGGSTPTDWIAFFNTPEGRIIYDLIKGRTQIISLGGNYALLDCMPQAPAGFSALRALLPNSWCLTMPPARTWLLEKLSKAAGKQKTATEWANDFYFLNELIRLNWKAQTLDIEQFLADPKTGEAYYWTLEDAVHYSYACAEIICTLLRYV